MSLGSILAGLIAPMLVVRGGWLAIFLAPGVLTVLIALLMVWLLPEAPHFRQGGVAAAVGRPSLASQLMEPAVRRAILHFGALYGMIALAMYRFINWLPVALPRTGFRIDAAARYLPRAQAGGLGSLLGCLTDRGWSRLIGCLVLVQFGPKPALLID